MLNTGDVPAGPCGTSYWMAHNACPATTDTTLNGKYATIFGGSSGVPVWKYGDLWDSGRWDASDPTGPKLISCNGQVEDKIWGTTTELYCGSQLSIGSSGCSPKAGDNACESACFASSDLDEVPLTTSKVKGLSCPSDVPAGQTFDVSYKVSGGGTSNYVYQGIFRNNPYSTAPDGCNIDPGDASCQWYPKTVSIKAPTTLGTYTYTVRTFFTSYGGGNCPNLPSIHYSEGGGVSNSCTVNVVQCIDEQNDPNKGNANPACQPKDNKAGTCVRNVCEYPACSSNSECVTGSCCGAVGAGGPGKTIDGTCQPKGSPQGYSNYLCDPGKWIKCDSTNVGMKQTFNGKSYTCVSESGEYKWNSYSIGETPNTISWIFATIRYFMGI
ncbi:hypothetical protein EPN87_04650 [archaeon]|nr:MAG: hypothetical protein EPN87_04650 [archaeon]